jgi:hypothetical protein
MPAESLDEQSTDTNNNDINVIIPISDQERLRWTDGNDGRILGLLYEISLHYVKMGLFQEFFEHGAVATNTTTQIPSASSMSFIMGEVADPVPHDFNNPCPAPAQRVAAALAARAANGEPASKLRIHHQRPFRQEGGQQAPTITVLRLRRRPRFGRAHRERRRLRPCTTRSSSRPRVSRLHG